MRFPIGKRERRFFDKGTLLDVIRFTNEKQLGEPPSKELIESADNEQKYPVVWHFFHEKVPNATWESFYRCGIVIDDNPYRVAVEPMVWEQLPIAMMEVALLGELP